VFVDARRPLGRHADSAGRLPKARQGTCPVHRRPTYSCPAESCRRPGQAEVLVTDQVEKAFGTRASGRQEKNAHQAFRCRRGCCRQE